MGGVSRACWWHWAVLGSPGLGGDRAQCGDPGVAPGRAECDTQQGPGAETSWWDLGLWRAVPGSSLHPSGCPLVPHTVSPSQWHCRGLVASGPAPEAQQRVQVTPGTNQLSSLSQNVQGECVFPKGNWSRNTGVRRSCLVKIVNKSP